MTSFVGEIRMFGGNFAPAGWMTCEGQILPIAENDVLFTLIGTTYGGDGQTTFALPDLRGRIPMHQGTTILGASSGTETVTLTTNQIPIHTHTALAGASVGHLSEPGNAVPAAHRDFAVFDASTNVPMAPTSLAAAGGNQPHDNMPPYLCVTFIISLFGIFPSQN